MKVLDVTSLQRDIEKTINHAEDKRSQVEDIQRAIRDFHLLDDALTGEAGDAIRHFYKDNHETFLIFLHQSLTDYTSVLKEMSEAITTFESDPNGYVSRIFLEGKVTAGFNKTGRQAMKFANETNDIIGNVSDLVSISPINESEVMNDVRQGKEKTNEIIEELVELDRFCTANLEDPQEKLQKMNAFLSDIESKFVSGNLSIEDYNLTDARESDAFRDITESVYGENGLIGIILGKQDRGEPLTETEIENLYDYYQHELLTDYKKQELENIASFMNEESISQLTDYLNEKVVTSDVALEEEIALVEAYLFLGTNTLTESGVNYGVRHKLEGYLALLNGYQSHINENDSVILVEDLTYSKNDLNVAFLNTEFKYGQHTGDGHTVTKWVDDEIGEYTIKDKDDFRDWLFFSSGYPVFSSETIKITSAGGSGGADNIGKTDLDELRKQLEDYDNDFIIKKVVSKVVSGLARKADVSDFLEAVNIIVGYDSGKQEIKEKVTAEEYLTIADDLGLSVNTSKASFEQNPRIELSPTDATFLKIERWKELHQEDARIPFPETMINEENWLEIQKELSLIGHEFGEQLLEFIDGDIQKPAKEIINELE